MVDHRLEIGAALLLLLLLLAGAAVAAPSYRAIVEPDAVVEHIPGDETRGRAALDLYRTCREDIGAILGLEEADRLRPIRIVLAPTDEEFDRRLKDFVDAVGRGWEMAIAIPGSDLIVIRGERLRADMANTLSGTLRHELSHIFLARRVAGRDRVPRWLDEGVAMRAEGRALTAAEWQILGREARGGSLIPLSRLSDTFPPHGRAVDLAYLEALSAVDHLARTRGRAVFRDVLGWVRMGDSFHNALRKYAGVSPETFETEWRAALIGESNVLKDVILNGGAGLAVMALVLVVWWRRRSNRRNRSSARRDLRRG